MSKFMKSLCKIAIPVTLQSMLQASFSIIDQVMIGQLGETNISAVGLCGNFSLIFSVVIGAVGTVAGILIAQFVGADDTKEAWCSFDVSFICGIIIATMFLLASGVLSSQILSLYTKDTSIISTGEVYFRIVAFSYIPMAISNILSAWLRCKEHAAIPFAASFVAVAVNTGLNCLLIFGKCGFALMGIKGAAIATLISQLFNLVCIGIGFMVCIQKDEDKPVLAFHFEKISLGDYFIMIMPILVSEFLGAVAVSVLLIFLAGIYTRLYRVDYGVKELGKILLIIFALYAPIKVENMILGGGIIRSGGNTKIIMVIDIIGTWCIGIPLCLVAVYVFKWGIIGVYTLLTTEEIFRLVMSLVIFRKRKWMISLS